MPSPDVVVCVSQDGLEPTLNFFLLPMTLPAECWNHRCVPPPLAFLHIGEWPWGFRHARQALTLPTELYPSVKLRCYDRLALFQDLILKAAIALQLEILTYTWILTIHMELRQSRPSENLIVPCFCPTSLTALLYSKDKTKTPNMTTQNTWGLVVTKFWHESQQMKL